MLGPVDAGCLAPPRRGIPDIRKPDLFFIAVVKDYLERIGSEGTMVESILAHGRKRTCSVESLVETSKLYMHVIGCTVQLPGLH